MDSTLSLSSPVTASATSASFQGRRRLLLTGAAVALGVIAAGMWNAQAADGFGRTVVAAHTIGDTSTLSGEFDQLGWVFGLAFAWIAGLAATFTACNCVVFAMLPGLACENNAAATSGRTLRTLATFGLGVILVGAVYGLFVGWLGPDRVQGYNAPQVRLMQARIIFSTLGSLMLVWGLVEFGYLGRIVARVPATIQQLLVRPQSKSALMGLMVGLFAVGRPFPVFRDFLNYAASAHSPLYGAVVMVLQGLGQITVMALLFALLGLGFGNRLTRWAVQRPRQASLVTAVALVAGGSYFIYYWGLALAFGIGQWGFRLGLYQ